MQYNYVMQPQDIPVYGYMPSAYSRDSIKIDEWSSLLGNSGILEQKQATSIWKRFKCFINRNFSCIYLN